MWGGNAMAVGLVLAWLCITCSGVWAARDRMAAYNLRVGRKYLDENRNKTGVSVLPSGVQYRVLTPGSGVIHPNETDRVAVHYRGTLIGGKEFDSSLKRSRVPVFTVSDVMSGWRDVLPRMVRFDQWEVVVPPEHAFGVHAVPELGVGSNAVLIFTLELKEIIGKDPLPPPPPPPAGKENATTTASAGATVGPAAPSPASVATSPAPPPPPPPPAPPAAKPPKPTGPAPPVGSFTPPSPAAAAVPRKAEL